MSGRKRFGEILIEAGVLTEQILQAALLRQQGTGRRLGLILEEMSVISEREIALVLGSQFHLKTVGRIAKHFYSPEVQALVDVSTVLTKFIFPLKVVKNTLHLAMSNPLDLETIDNLSFSTGLTIIPYVTTATEIQAAAEVHYLKGTPRKPTACWRVLIVEDVEVIRSSIVEALKDAGYQTLEAANGAEGLKTAILKQPHLIVADIMMPLMDGYEMFKSLKANSETEAIPVVALTARSMPQEESRLLELGFYDFIPKPVNIVRLLARIKRALRHAHGQSPRPSS